MAGFTMRQGNDFLASLAFSLLNATPRLEIDYLIAPPRMAYYIQSLPEVRMLRSVVVPFESETLGK